MTYRLRNGTSRRNVEALQKLREEGKVSGAVPMLDEAPLLLPSAVRYWKAWEALDGSRSFREKLVPNPLSPSDIVVVAGVFGFNLFSLRREFFDMMRQLDDIVLAWFADLKAQADRKRHRQR